MDDKIKELAKPLKEYLEEHYDPHCQVVVSMDTVKVIRTEEQKIFEPQPYGCTSKKGTTKLDATCQMIADSVQKVLQKPSEQ